MPSPFFVLAYSRIMKILVIEDDREAADYLEKALAEVDVEKRAAMYRDLNDQIMAVVPGVPYASVPAFLAFKPGVKGFVTSPVAQESMATVTVD